MSFKKDTFFKSLSVKNDIICDFSEKMLHFKILIFSKNVTNLKLYCSVSFFLQFSEKMLQYFCLLARKRGDPMELNQKELKKLEIIKKVIKKEMTINEATMN